MKENDSRPQVESHQELEELAQKYQSTSFVDVDSEEVPIEPSRMPMVSRSIRMEQSVMSEIRKVAAKQGMPVTQLMRQWVQQGLERAKAEESSTPNAEASSVVITSAESESVRVSPERFRSLRKTVRGRYESSSQVTVTRTREAKIAKLMHRHTEAQ